MSKITYFSARDGGEKFEMTMDWILDTPTHPNKSGAMNDALAAANMLALALRRFTNPASKKLVLDALKRVSETGSA